MDDEYYMTEEQRIQLEMDKAEKQKGKEKWKRKIVWAIAVIAVLAIIWFAFLRDLYYEMNYTVRKRKPVIYLYPEDTTEVSVTLDINGDLTTTYPKYENGWTVTADPDGTLTDALGKSYNYLYWEAETDASFDMSEGFCVKGSETAEFLENALSELGLTRREANEFIVYWLPLMEGNEYNVISFQSEAYTNNAKLYVNPEPDTLIRVFMTWYGSKKPVEIKEQKLTAPERKGFTVVEWGGSMVK